MTFSVIIPTYNRVQALERALEGLLRQDFSDFEVIVVNDGSTDHTSECLSKLARDGRVVQVNQALNRGPASARNAGVLRAKGKYLAFTDDDCIVPPGWLNCIYQAFQSKGVDIVGGAVRNSVPGNLYSDVSQETINHFVQFLGEGGKSTHFLTSNNIAYTSEAIRRAGGFNEVFRHAGGEERELNLRILGSGGRSFYAETLVVGHSHGMTARGFFRQQRFYGQGACLLHRLSQGEAGTGPRNVPFRAHLSLCRQFISEHPLRGILKILLYLAGQGMVLVGFLQESLVPRPRSDG